MTERVLTISEYDDTMSCPTAVLWIPDGMTPDQVFVAWLRAHSEYWKERIRPDITSEELSKHEILYAWWEHDVQYPPENDEPGALTRVEALSMYETGEPSRIAHDFILGTTDLGSLLAKRGDGDADVVECDKHGKLAVSEYYKNGTIRGQMHCCTAEGCWGGGRYDGEFSAPNPWGVWLHKAEKFAWHCPVCAVQGRLVCPEGPPPGK